MKQKSVDTVLHTVYCHPKQVIVVKKHATASLRRNLHCQRGFDIGIEYKQSCVLRLPKY
jgi:hypothetical protein